MIDIDAGGASSGTDEELVQFMIQFAATRQESSCGCEEFHGDIGSVEEEEASSMALQTTDPLEWYLEHQDEQRSRVMANRHRLILSPDAQVANRWRLSSYSPDKVRLCTVYVDDRFDSPVKLFEGLCSLADLMPIDRNPMEKMYRTWDFSLLTEATFELVAQELAMVAKTLK